MVYEIKRAGSLFDPVVSQLKRIFVDINTRFISLESSGGVGQVVAPFPSMSVGAEVLVRAPYGFTITGWTVLGNATGSCSIDIEKDTYANYPPTGADSIVAAAPPTVTNANRNQSTTLTGWTTGVSSGNVLRFVISSVSGFTELSVYLDITRT